MNVVAIIIVAVVVWAIVAIAGFWWATKTRPGRWEKRL